MFTIYNKSTPSNCKFYIKFTSTLDSPNGIPFGECYKYVC